MIALTLRRSARLAALLIAALLLGASLPAAPRIPLGGITLPVSSAPAPAAQANATGVQFIEFYSPL